MSANHYTLWCNTPNGPSLELQALLNNLEVTGSGDHAFNQALAREIQFNEWRAVEVQAVSMSIFCVSFQTETSGKLPLHLIKGLMGRGVRALVLDVFYDQVGEVERSFFADNQWVSRAQLLEQFPEWSELATKQIDEEEEYGEESINEPAKPTSIDELIKQEQGLLDLAMKVVETLQMAAPDVPAINKKSSAPAAPKNSAGKSTLVKVIIKGVLPAVVFTAVTVFLFKGIWLWIALGLGLIITLPYLYVSKLRKKI